MDAPGIQLWQAQGWRQLPFPFSDTEDSVVEEGDYSELQPIHVLYSGWCL